MLSCMWVPTQPFCFSLSVHLGYSELYNEMGLVLMILPNCRLMCSKHVYGGRGSGKMFIRIDALKCIFHLQYFCLMIFSPRNRFIGIYSHCNFGGGL